MNLEPNVFILKSVHNLNLCSLSQFGCANTGVDVIFLLSSLIFKFLGLNDDFIYSFLCQRALTYYGSYKGAEIFNKPHVTSEFINFQPHFPTPILTKCNVISVDLRSLAVESMISIKKKG